MKHFSKHAAGFLAASMGTFTLSAAHADEGLSLTTVSVSDVSGVQSVGGGNVRAAGWADIIYVDDSGDLRFYINTPHDDPAFVSALIDDSATHQKIWVSDLNEDNLADVITISAPPTNEYVSSINVFISKDSSSNDPTASYFHPKQTYTPTIAGQTFSASNFITIDDLDFGMMQGIGSFDIVFHATLTNSSSATDGDEPPTTTYASQGYYGILLTDDSGDITLANALAKSQAFKSSSDALLFTALFSGHVAAGDFNNDGKTDMALCYSDNSVTPPDTFIYPGYGDGSFDTGKAFGLSVEGCRDGGALRPQNNPQQDNKYSAGDPSRSYADRSNVARYFLIGYNHTQVFYYNSDWSDTDGTGQRIQNTQLAVLGPFADFNGDGSSDWMLLDGDNSKLVIWWDWDSTDDGRQPDDPDITMGSVIQTGDYANFGTSLADFVTLNSDGNIVVYMNNTYLN